MSTVTELNQPLLALTEAGVSVWLDQIRRSMVEGGELARMVAVESLRGVTSNPAILEKAILGSTADRDLETLRSYGPPAQRVDTDGDPAQAIRALTERITAILQES